jgi:hypothetical protein
LIEEGQPIHWPNEKVQVMMYTTLHIKLKIEQHEPDKLLKPGVNSDALEE